MTLLPDIRMILALAIQAGDEQLRYFGDQNLDIKLKEDDSPLTQADLGADQIITRGLKKIRPDIPVLSEESPDISYSDRKNWEYYWLVDPLDGTKEFIKKNNEFTVNIALIHENQSILGVIHAPAKKKTYYGIKGKGAFRVRQDQADEQIMTSDYRGSRLKVIGSRSHGNKRIRSFLDKRVDYEFIEMGSSLKFCMIADGIAHLYLRFGPTMEWDTAAGDCILREAGGTLTDLEDNPLVYNKPDLTNPEFVALANPPFPWKDYFNKEGIS